jgi:hypothetical protein
LISIPKNAGAAEPVLNANMLKLEVNQTKNIWCNRISVRSDGSVGEILR